MFASNLRYLRKIEGLSQHALAEQLGIPRTTLASYELAKSEPNLAMLRRIAAALHISIDSLIGDDLAIGAKEIARTNDLRVLAVSLDSSQEENVELVEARAQAGYAEQFAQPGYIGELPKIALPMFEHGTYRAFEVEGDSMLPLAPGSIVICSFVEHLRELKEGKTHVVVTRSNSVVYKRLYRDPAQNALIATSDNPLFPPFVIQETDVLELWQYEAHLSFSDQPTSAMYNSRLDQIEAMLRDLTLRIG